MQTAFLKIKFDVRWLYDDMRVLLTQGTAGWISRGSGAFYDYMQIWHVCTYVHFLKKDSCQILEG